MYYSDSAEVKKRGARIWCREGGGVKASGDWLKITETAGMVGA